jgi:hypothetical protein
LREEFGLGQACRCDASLVKVTRQRGMIHRPFGREKGVSGRDQELAARQLLPAARLSLGYRTTNGISSHAAALIRRF